MEFAEPWEQGPAVVVLSAAAAPRRRSIALRSAARGPSQFGPCRFADCAWQLCCRFIPLPNCFGSRRAGSMFWPRLRRSRAGRCLLCTGLPGTSGIVGPMGAPMASKSKIESGARARRVCSPVAVRLSGEASTSGPIIAGWRDGLLPASRSGDSAQQSLLLRRASVPRPIEAYIAEVSR